MNSPILHHCVDWSILVTRFLVEQSLVSVLIFVPVLLLSLLLRRRSPRLLLGLWMLVLIRLLLPPSFALPTSVHRFWLPGGAPRPLQPVHASAIGVEENSLAPKEAPQDLDPTDLVPIIVVVAWLSGAVLLFCRHAGHHIHLRRFLKNARPVQEIWLIQRLQDWQRHLRLHGRYRVVSSHSGQGPFVSGLGRLTIYIPQTLLQLNDRTLLESVLAHELAHIKRRDYMVLPLQALVQVCFFFNPIVWMAVSRINLLRECACDTLVLEKKVLPSQTYASAVIRALKHTIDPVPTMSVGAALGHRTAKFKYRIEHMKGEHTMSRLAGTLRFLFLLLLAVTVLPMAQPPGQVVSPGDTSPASPGGLVLTNPLSLMKVTLGFGPARHPYTGEMWHHQGIDLAAKKQTEVHAGAAGRVIEAVNEYTINKGAGRYVTLQHENGYSTRYTHLHTLAVKQGDLVKAGEIIGTVGTTGLSTGPHLHFEVWFHDKPVDPAPYLQHSN